MKDGRSLKPKRVEPNVSGRLFVVSAPSGGGKTTLCRAVRSRIPDIRYSVSYTTRKPRPDEQNGIDYHFIDEKSFKRGIARGEWAEWARVHGHYYGTSAKAIEQMLAAGNDVLLDIDVQGASQITRRYPEAVTIFIMPPSLEELRRRLESRGTDSPEEIKRRLSAAEKEMAKKDCYRHVIVNDHLDKALDKLVSIIESDRSAQGMTERREKKKDRIS
ncbi:MAG: guanylate kinase [Deltaproteobacteria bacterium]|nr:guanylate kinase [Deltaproteobacteria bacterium]MBW2154021.1 guanylate kinase [Deltaproteobacteria bacterium]